MRTEKASSGRVSGVECRVSRVSSPGQKRRVSLLQRWICARTPSYLCSARNATSVFSSSPPRIFAAASATPAVTDASMGFTGVPGLRRPSLFAPAMPSARRGGTRTSRSGHNAYARCMEAATSDARLSRLERLETISSFSRPRRARNRASAASASAARTAIRLAPTRIFLTSVRTKYLVSKGDACRNTESIASRRRAADPFPDVEAIRRSATSTSAAASGFGFTSVICFLLSAAATSPRSPSASCVRLIRSMDAPVTSRMTAHTAAAPTLSSASRTCEG